MRKRFSSHRKLSSVSLGLAMSGFGLPALSGNLKLQRSAAARRSSKQMTIAYQLLRSDVIAFSNEQRRFVSRRPSTVYYYCLLPALVVALAIVTQSLTVAMVFAVLFLSSGWLVGHWVEQSYRDSAYSDENLAV